jgi:selenocysteine-specific elongation factor
VKLTVDEQKLWAKVQPLLEAAPFQPPRVRDLAHALLVEEERMRQLLKHVARIGEVYPVAQDHYYTRRAVAELAQTVRLLASEQGHCNGSGVSRSHRHGPQACDPHPRVLRSHRIHSARQ